MPPDPSRPYPRPDFQREPLHWHSLNGPWEFVFDDGDVGLEQEWFRRGLPEPMQRIEVPFVFQCKASGVQQGGVHEVLWYQRTLDVSWLCF